MGENNELSQGKDVVWLQVPFSHRRAINVPYQTANWRELRLPGQHHAYRCQ